MLDKLFQRLLTLVVMATCDVIAQPQEALRYRVTENVRVGTRIGNVVVDSGLSRQHPHSVLRQLRFRFLTRPALPVDIGYTDGVIVTTGDLDREAMTSCRQQAQCDVTVDVTVQPVTYFRIIKVVVEVLDENDNTPRFGESSHAVLSISESASVGTSFLLPSATDADSPQFGVSRYELLTAYKQFTDPVTTYKQFGLRVTPKLDGFLDVRLVLRRRLDRETTQLYRLKLAAFDGGQPALYDVVNVTVKVLDSNDNDPVFEKSSYELRLSEGQPANTRVLTVRATDADLNANDRLIYGLTRQSRHQLGHLFRVDNKTGDVYVIGHLDRESTAEYNLIVTAEDALPGTPEAHTVDVTVRVKILDVNDNAPRIIFNTLRAADASIAHVSENSVSESFVAHVTASDADEGRNALVSCQLTRHADNQLFKLVPRPFQQLQAEADYELVTSQRSAVMTSSQRSAERSERSADRETRGRFNVTVLCSDDGTPAPLTSYKSLTVYVTDDNDNTPAFTSQVYVYSTTHSLMTSARYHHVHSLQFNFNHDE